MKVIVVCKCGKEFKVYEHRIKKGRGKFCSQKCKYTYRVRPKGLKYILKKINPTSFKPGHTNNKKGSENLNWKGEKVGYRWLHIWVAENKKKPKECEICGQSKKLEWANISREYKRDLSDWMALCKLCHRRYDAGEFWGKATEKFGRKAVQEGYAYTCE